MKQNVLEREMPFVAQVSDKKVEMRIGVAEGKFTAPDDIDKFNDEIADMFGVDE